MKLFGPKRQYVGYNDTLRWVLIDGRLRAPVPDYAHIAKFLGQDVDWPLLLERIAVLREFREEIFKEKVKEKKKQQQQKPSRVVEVSVGEYFPDVFSLLPTNNSLANTTTATNCTYNDDNSSDNDEGSRRK